MASQNMALQAWHCKHHLQAVKGHQVYYDKYKVGEEFSCFLEPGNPHSPSDSAIVVKIPTRKKLQVLCLWAENIQAKSEA